MSTPAYPIVSWKAAGASSDILKLNGNQIIGFITGATLVSTTMTFSMVPALSTATNPAFIPVNGSAGTPISFTVAPNQYYGFSADQQSIFVGVEVLKFVGGSSEAVGTTIRAVIIPRQY